MKHWKNNVLRLFVWSDLFGQLARMKLKIWLSMLDIADVKYYNSVTVTTSKLNNQIVFSAVFMLRSLNNMQWIFSGIIYSYK